MASLTEAAKAVLEGKSLQEGAALPTVGSVTGGVSNPNPVDGSTASTGNAKTLRPGSKTVDPRHSNPGAPSPAEFSGVDDLDGQTPTELPDENLGAKAAGKVGKDTSRSGQASVKAEPAKKLNAMAEEIEDDSDVVEESQTLSLAERLKALKESRKMKKDEEDEKEEKHEGKMEKCDEELELSEELEDFINEGIEAGLSEEEILAAIDENFEFISEEEETVSEEVAEVAEALETYEVDMSEHVNALLEGENLSEEFHAKATTIFEAAVKAKLEEEVALLEQAYSETLEERVNEIMEELASNVDDYLNYVVEQWVEENEVAVESALRSELTEDFISGLRALFAEHYIDIPEEEVAVVEELSQTVEELEAKLNEEIQRNVELTSMLSESRKVELTAVVCEGLTSTQAAKLKALTEGVEYTSDEEFIEKVSTLRENYFPVAVKTDEVLDRVESSNDPQALTEGALNGPMANYVKALGRSLPK
jgi:hypothetical protein